VTPILARNLAGRKTVGPAHPVQGILWERFVAPIVFRCCDQQALVAGEQALSAWPRWTIECSAGVIGRADLLIAFRLDDTNNNVLDYFLLPTEKLTAQKLQLTRTNCTYLASQRRLTLLARRQRPKQPGKGLSANYPQPGSDLSQGPPKGEFSGAIGQG